MQETDSAVVTVRLDLPDELSTEALAGRLAPLVRPGDVFALWGDLGVGKTVFARAFVRARGNRHEDVPSPTFTLVQVYDSADGSPAPTYHFDLFRLESSEDAYELGIEEAFTGGVSLVEWPDRLGRLLPADRLDVTLAEGSAPEARRVVLEGRGGWRDRLAAVDFLGAGLD